MRAAEPATVTQDVRDVPAEVPMPATEGRRYTLLVALGYGSSTPQASRLGKPRHPLTSPSATTRPDAVVARVADADKQRGCPTARVLAPWQLGPVKLDVTAWQSRR